MSTFVKRDLPVIIVAVFGFGVVAQWFIPLGILDSYRSFLANITTIMGNTAFGVGMFYGITAEYNMLRRNRTLGQYFVSGSYFAFMLIMTFVIFAYGFPNAVAVAPEYKWYTYNVYQWQAQAQYGIMFLYQCGAIYRVLRLRSMETTVIAICGLAFILRSIPLFVSYIPGLMEVGDWVAGAPALGGTRAATLTSSLGGLIVGCRALIGKEQTTIEVR